MNRISSLEGITSLKYLTSLNISHNLVYSLLPLRDCVNLTYLDVSYNSIGFIRQVDYLNEIPWLQVLIMKGNPCVNKAYFR
jgi:Leucine-rich repeat (LRR) protein